MKFVCISDTHGKHRKMRIPDGDVLIHAGDFTMGGREQEIADFNFWLESLPHMHKVVVPGNHDMLFESSPGLARVLLPAAKVLIHEEVVVEGMRVFGSPWTPVFHDWAFNYKQTEANERWSTIPDGVDVVVTHGPARCILDNTKRTGERAGCPALLKRLQQVRPKLHICGHIHEGRGWAVIDGITHVNASMLDYNYQPTNEAIIIDI